MFLTSLALPQSIRTLLVHTLLVTDLFAPLAQLDIATLLTKKQKPAAAQLLHYTSQGHVLGFGKSRVVIAAQTHALTINLVGAKKVAPFSEEKHQKKDRPGTMPSPLTTVSYKHPWPGVTVFYHHHEHSIVKSDYFLEAGQIKKGLSKICLNYNRPVELDKQGRLVIEYAIGSMQESRPVAWQEISGKKKSVEVNFVKHSNQTIGFSAWGYDERYPLIIDPELTWSTFLGSSGNDYGNSIALDTSGNILVTGESNATWGSPKRAYTGGYDAYAAKLDSSGNLLWNTFLGSSGADYGYSIAVDTSGNVLVTGFSDATWETPKIAHSGAIDAFAAKLDSSGNLLWNTFLGSSDSDYGKSIAVDTSGNVLISGESLATWGSPKQAYTGGRDAFAAKLDSSGNLLWNTFLGSSSGTDYGRSIAVDTSGNVLVSGDCSATWGSPIRAYTSGSDAFAAKLDSSGNLLWNTFLGDSDADFSNAIAVDTSGNVLVGGHSGATWGTPQRAYTASYDSFAARLDSNGNLIWNTFLGGSSYDYCYAIRVDNSGNVLVGGHSGGTWGSPEWTYTAGGDAFAARLDSNGNLIWNAFWGDSGSDYTSALALDTSGNILICGDSTASWGSPINPYTGGTEAFAVKIADLQPTETPTDTKTYTPTYMFSPTYTKTYTPTYMVSPIYTPTYTPTYIASPAMTSTPPITLTPIQSVTPQYVPDFFKIYTPLVRASRNETLRIGFQLQQAGFVRISISDIMGRQVFALAQSYNPGQHDIGWDVRGAGSGTYLVYFDSPNHKQRGKFVLVR